MHCVVSINYDVLLHFFLNTYLILKNVEYFWTFLFRNVLYEHQNNMMYLQNRVNELNLTSGLLVI